MTTPLPLTTWLCFGHVDVKRKDKMATVEHLPPEVLAYLLSFLQGKEIGRVSGTCRHFREAAKVESVWQRRCREGKSFIE